MVLAQHVVSSGTWWERPCGLAGSVPVWLWLEAGWTRFFIAPLRVNEFTHCAAAGAAILPVPNNRRPEYTVIFLVTPLLPPR